MVAAALLRGVRYLSSNRGEQPVCKSRWCNARWEGVSRHDRGCALAEGDSAGMEGLVTLGSRCSMREPEGQG